MYIAHSSGKDNAAAILKIINELSLNVVVYEARKFLWSFKRIARDTRGEFKGKLFACLARCAKCRPCSNLAPRVSLLCLHCRWQWRQRRETLGTRLAMQFFPWLSVTH